MWRKMFTLKPGCIYNNKDLAEWFGIKQSSFETTKKRKLEELKEYADFEMIGPKVKILSVKQERYVKNSAMTQEEIQQNETYQQEENYLADEYAFFEAFYYNSGYMKRRRELDETAKFTRAYPFAGIRIIFDKFGVQWFKQTCTIEDCPQNRLKSLYCGNTLIYIFNDAGDVAEPHDEDREKCLVKLNEIYDSWYYQNDALVLKGYRHGLYPKKRARAKIAVSRIITLSNAIDICNELMITLGPEKCAGLEMMFFNDPQVLLGIADNVMSTRG